MIGYDCCLIDLRCQRLCSYFVDKLILPYTPQTLYS